MISFVDQHYVSNNVQIQSTGLNKHGSKLDLYPKILP